LEGPCDFGIEPPGFISNGVSVKLTENRLLGRLRRRWDGNIRMDLKKPILMQGIWPIWLRIGIIGKPL
jgi:hypothetical protein